MCFEKIENQTKLYVINKDRDSILSFRIAMTYICWIVLSRYCDNILRPKTFFSLSRKQQSWPPGWGKEGKGELISNLQMDNWNLGIL